MPQRKEWEIDNRIIAEAVRGVCWWANRWAWSIPTFSKEGDYLMAGSGLQPEPENS